MKKKTGKFNMGNMKELWKSYDLCELRVMSYERVHYLKNN